MRHVPPPRPRLAHSLKPLWLSTFQKFKSPSKERAYRGKDGGGSKGRTRHPGTLSVFIIPRISNFHQPRAIKLSIATNQHPLPLAFSSPIPLLTRPLPVNPTRNRTLSLRGSTRTRRGSRVQPHPTVGRSSIEPSRTPSVSEERAANSAVPSTSRVSVTPSSIKRS